MNLSVKLPLKERIAVSPYARRLAHETEVDLKNVVGSGPGARILAADVLAHQSSIAKNLPELPAPRLRAASCTFLAQVSLNNFFQLTADAARVGLDIAIEDVASRAALSGMASGEGRAIAIEAEGRQIMICAANGLSINAERKRRQAALDCGAEVSAEPVAASLLVLHSARVVPGGLPLLPGRVLRFVLVVDHDRELGHALLCADGDAINEIQAIALLEAFVSALEQPLALLA